MRISVMRKTGNPVDLISMCAGVCYGRNDSSIERVERCYRNGHMSPFEHASVTFRVEGISRACANQIVRHRLASYCQESQRYCKADFSTEWFVTPDSVASNMETTCEFAGLMDDCAKLYEKLLKSGVKPEDARYVLPVAAKTTIVVTMNVRELFHFWDVRSDPRAQWEIRELAGMMRKSLWTSEDDWKPIVELWEGPHERR